MTTEANFGASDAQVRVTDDSTRLEKARASMAYYDREIHEASVSLTRLTAKLDKYEEHVASIKKSLDQAQAYIAKLHEQQTEAMDTVRALAPDKEV